MNITKEVKDLYLKNCKKLTKELKSKKKKDRYSMLTD